MQTREEIERFLASPSFSDATRRSYGVDLDHFARWLEDRKLRLDRVGARELTEYAAELGRGRSRLAPASIARRLAAVRSFLRFALGAANVPDVALAPRRPRRLPDPPPVAEVDATLDALDGDEPLAFRNRALVELVYSCGLRSAEAVDVRIAFSHSVEFGSRGRTSFRRARVAVSEPSTCLNHAWHRDAAGKDDQARN